MPNESWRVSQSERMEGIGNGKRCECGQQPYNGSAARLENGRSLMTHPVDLHAELTRVQRVAIVNHRGTSTPLGEVTSSRQSGAE